MNILQAIILGTIQGLTEFLPVSSSGHLVIAQSLLGLEEPMLSYDILLHVATLIVVLWYLKEVWVPMLTDTIIAAKKGAIRDIPKEVWIILVATIPAGIVGFLIRPILETFFQTNLMIGFGLLITSAFLLVSHGYKTVQSKSLDYKNGFIVGVFQAIAIIPSISRSGLTVSSAIMLGISRKKAFTFSFLLSIPAIIGAQLLDLPELFNTTTSEIPAYLIGFVTAAVSGYFSLRLFEKMVLEDTFHHFGYYCFFLGMLIIFLM